VRVAIGVGLIEERDPEVEGLVDDLAGRGEIGATAAIVATEAGNRDLQAGLSEISLLHLFRLRDQLSWRRKHEKHFLRAQLFGVSL
jgi:hypothetical protein